MALEQTVGPNPFGAPGPASNGQLQVFTMAEQYDTYNETLPPVRRTGCTVYADNGKRVKRVIDNNAGRFDYTPRTISLPPGAYSVHAFLADGLGQWTIVRVQIEPGRKTEVHLDGEWQSPGHGSPKLLVHAPNGMLVGWRAGTPTRSGS